MGWLLFMGYNPTLSVGQELARGLCPDRFSACEAAFNELRVHRWLALPSPAGSNQRPSLVLCLLHGHLALQPSVFSLLCIWGLP